MYCVKGVENESGIVYAGTGRVDARVLRGPLGSLGAPDDVVARCCLVALAEDSRGASKQFRGREWIHDAAPPRSAASKQPRQQVRPSDPCGRRGAIRGSSWGATIIIIMGFICE